MAAMDYGYGLALDEDEMIFLRDVMSMIAGDPKNSRRKYADAILDAIKQDVPAADKIKDIKQDIRSGMYSCIWFTQASGEL